jgi:hypothetical protein
MTATTDVLDLVQRGSRWLAGGGWPARPASRAATTPAGSVSPWSPPDPPARWMLANAHIGMLHTPAGPPSQ